MIVSHFLPLNQMRMFRTLLQHKKKQQRNRRSITDKRELAAEEVLEEVGIKGKVLDELSLKLQMEKRQKAEAKQQEGTIIKVSKCHPYNAILKVI